MKFKSFEIIQREHSPNAIFGYTEEGKKVFVTAPASSLGKELGDRITITLHAALEERLFSQRWEDYIDRN